MHQLLISRVISSNLKDAIHSLSFTCKCLIPKFIGHVSPKLSEFVLVLYKGTVHSNPLDFAC